MKANNNFQKKSKKLSKIIDRLVCEGREFEIYERHHSDGTFQKVDTIAGHPHYCMVKIKGISASWSFLPNSPIVYSAVTVFEKEFPRNWDEENGTLQIGCTNLTIQGWKKLTIREIIKLGGKRGARRYIADIGKFDDLDRHFDKYDEEDYYLPMNEGNEGMKR